MDSSSVFHRSLNKSYPTAASGAGVYIIGADGSRTLDGSSGAAVSCLGHGHPVVIEAIVEQARQLAFAHTSFFTSGPAEKLANLLMELSDGAFSKAIFLSSGSEAVETALKLARQYHVSKNQPQRVNIISREYSYHGNTLGALAAGFNPPRRKPFEPLLSPAFHHVSRCFYPKDAQSGETEETYVDRLIKEYENTFQKLGPSTVAAVIIETMGGATLGAVPAAKGYTKKLRDLCDKHGALLIFDEVMCGMGRAGTLHAWQSLGGVPPDLQTIGKGLGAGYQPISGILVSSKVHQTIQTSESSAPFISGHTYQGHILACATALATQQVIIKDQHLVNVFAMGDLLEQKLRATVPCLQDVRGLGLFKAVEFKTPSGEHIAAEVTKTCLANGVATYLCSSAVDAILFAPPFIITKVEIIKLVDIFTTSTKQVLEKRGIEY